jgi:hypothetical protein
MVTKSSYYTNFCSWAISIGTRPRLKLFGNTPKPKVEEFGEAYLELNWRFDCIKKFNWNIKNLKTS